LGLALYPSRVRSSDLLERITRVPSVKAKTAVQAFSGEIVSIPTFLRVKELAATRAAKINYRHEHYQHYPHDKRHAK
jgi:hypothetical protein